MAAGWGLSPWRSPIQPSGHIPTTNYNSGWLPGFQTTTLSPKARRWSENYLARLKAEDWSKEIRPLIIARAQGFCEGCGKRSEYFEVHHLHYETLWHETPDDLQALCPSCHDIADRERREHIEWLAADALEVAQFRRFCHRVYGDVPPPLDAWDRFDNWIESKTERERWE
jgi:hypothetical protein